MGDAGMDKGGHLPPPGDVVKCSCELACCRQS